MTPIDLSKIGVNKQIKKITKWEIPRDSTGALLLTMPNIPEPLYRLAPRNLYGEEAWKNIRQSCLKTARYKCEACGMQLWPREPQVHELYSYNYFEGIAIFQRCVCLCDTCHKGVHSGHTVSEYLRGNISKSRLLEIVENLFSIISDHNNSHKNIEPLRVYKSFMRCLNIPDLHNEFLALLEKYKIDFYAEDRRCMADQRTWQLLALGSTFLPCSKELLAREWAIERAEQKLIYQPSYAKEA